MDAVLLNTTGWENVIYFRETVDKWAIDESISLNIDVRIVLEHFDYYEKISRELFKKKTNFNYS